MGSATVKFLPLMQTDYSLIFSVLARLACDVAFFYATSLAIVSGGTRKSYNTSLRTDLEKELRILVAKLEKRQNDLLEEAIRDLLKKYEEKKEA